MRRQCLVSVVPVLVGTLAAAPVAAQRANFGGTWARVDLTPTRTVAATGDASFARGDPGSGWGSPLTITHDAQRLDVEFQVFSTYDLQPPLHFSFALDGSNSTNRFILSHTETEVRSTSVWSGDALVITSRQAGPQGPNGRPLDVVVRQTLRLVAPDSLVIEATRDGILGAAAVTTRTVYARKQP